MTDDLRARLERLAWTLDALADSSAESADMANNLDFECGVDTGKADTYRWAATRIREEVGK